jgi:ankyrin repeat protein
MCAAEGGCVSMVEKLIADGASVNAVDLEKQTALSLASDPEVIRLLLDANAEVDRDTVNPALLGACRKSQPESVRMLLEVNAPVNVYPSLLTEALRPLPPGMPVGNKLEVLSLLLGAGVDPRVMNYGNSALHSCAMSHKADQADVIDAAGLLLDHDPGLLELCDHRGFTALALAAEKSSVGMVRFLISRSADVNARDLTGRSVLAVAVDDPSFGTDPGAVRKTVQALLKAGADPAAGSAGCQSLLMRLVAKSQRDSLLDDAASAAVVGDIANAMGMEMTEKKP